MKPHYLLCFFILNASTLLGQDGHYWTQQYGTKSMLLSGSVIGGVEDLGAVYYNPGRLAVIANSAFLLSASVYEYNAIKISDAFGTARNATKSDIKGVPTLAAGTFKVKFLPKHFFAYAIMTRQSSDMSFSFRDEVHKDVIAGLPGDEYFGAEISFTNSALEQWIGLTWSHALSSKVSVGVTTNFTTTNQNRGAKIQLQALSAANEVAMYRYNRSYNYKQNGFLWKGGVALDLDPWQLGLTVTTPTLRISGSGAYNFEEIFSSVPTLTRPESYSTSYQDGLDVNSKTPWSFGFGATRKLGRNKIHFSTEFYTSIPKYSVMRAADHQSQSNPNDTIRFHLVDQMKGIWNAGIGAELYISEHVSGFASFSTDFTSVTSDLTRFVQRQDEAANSSWNADFYHIGGGIVISVKGADITLGATHTGANEEIARPVSFPDNPSQPIFASGNTADLRWDRWRFVFSFSLPFLKDYTKKLTEEKK